MANLTIAITKNDVLKEVAKTTAYIGGKSVDNSGKSLYDQVFVTDTDKAMLERFFLESTGTLRNLLKRFDISETASSEGNISWVLSMPSSYDTKLNTSIKNSCVSFLVNSIIAKWCEITVNEKTKEYQENALALLEDIKDKVFYKKKPSRKSIN